MKLVPHCLFVILFVFFLLTGLVGIDFGSHFEEERLLNSVEQSKRTGLFIPRWYNYPSFSYDLCLLAMAPEMVFSLPPIPNESTMALFPEPSSRPAENPSDPSSLISIHAEKVFPTTTEQPSALASTVVLPEITKLIEPTPSMEPQEAAGSSLTVKHHSEPVDVTEPAGYLDTEGAAPSRYEPETAAQPTPTSAGIVAESLKKAPRSEPALMNITATSASIAGLSAASSFTVLFITAEQRISNDVKFRTASSHPLTLRIRSIFLLISAISMLWIYLGVGLWRKNWITALLAASFMGLSWEMAYHARWIAPDVIFVQFASLTVFLVFTAFLLSTPLSYARTWLFCSAAAAGFACGTAYLGVVLLLPVLCTVALLPPAHFSVKPQPLYLPIAAFFVAGFAITTPAVFVEPYNVFRDIMAELLYFQDQHPGHAVKSMLDHYSVMIVYLSSVVLSPFQGISWLFSIVLLVGLWAVLSQDQKTALILLSFPVVYFLYSGHEKAMVARNLLVLLPFMAVLCAIGVEYLLKISRSFRFIQYGIFAIVTITFLTNAAWIGYAALTIPSRGSVDMGLVLDRYLARHTHQHYVLSPMVSQKVSSNGAKSYPNVVEQMQPDVKLILFSSEAKIAKHNWPANRMGRYQMAGSGLYEVNYDYYPDWIGDDRIIIVDNKTADALGF